MNKFFFKTNTFLLLILIIQNKTMVKLCVQFKMHKSEDAIISK